MAAGIVMGACIIAMASWKRVRVDVQLQSVEEGYSSNVDEAQIHGCNRERGEAEKGTA